MQVEETLQCVPHIRIVIENTNDFPLVGHDAEMRAGRARANGAWELQVRIARDGAVQR